ncbi:hypothetical protein TSOC_009526 [Tetrabaena socialis]|uniref:Uncharacterized protein n=1 Tax=Tetrabaena socialis TaxID=47790 RepID=A0A2J7ZVL3_9CHLO|nr:hypothetical protein TSOC_009526 [Tetrabaena socialis]|eukprot:PNH04317.1 hypothetical protein TSOC_009526 [Tetrabaena socialis]
MYSYVSAKPVGNEAGNKSRAISRCCPSAAYPDVLVLVDRGVSACALAAPAGSGLDLSLLQTTWTTARELTVLPGGALQLERDYGEIDMASSEQLAAFLLRAFARFPPTSTTTAAASATTVSTAASATAATLRRKYGLVLWDHGNGWKGYGVDDTCAANTASAASGCNHFTLATLAKGLAVGLAAAGADGGAGKLDVLGFDACLMATYEVAAAMAPYARTLLASELLEPGHGWDYAAFGAMTLAASDASIAAATTAAGGTAAATGAGVAAGVVGSAGSVAASGAAVGASTAGTAAGAMAEEIALARIWIARYRAQAVAYGTTGVTLALADLGVASSQPASVPPTLLSTVSRRSSVASSQATEPHHIRLSCAWSYVLAGAQAAVVDGRTVTGAWRRLLWGVTQTLAAADGSRLSRSALMFAAEEWVTSADGATALSVSLTANVLYGGTCSTVKALMAAGILKYTYV